MLVWGAVSLSSVFADAEGAAAGSVYSWDFSDCSIRDILYVVSLDTGISIVCDDTVNGKADFRFTGKDFETAFDSFLKGARLYVSKEDDLWTVSRFRLVEQNGLYCLDACDLSAEQIVERLSLLLGSALTFEVLPAGTMNVHFKGLNEFELLESLCLRLNGYLLEKKDSGFHFAKKTVAVNAGGSGFGNVDVHFNEDGTVWVDVRDSRAGDVLEALFGLNGIIDAGGMAAGGMTADGTGFCLLAGSDVKITRSFFVGKNFEDALQKVCAQSGLDVIRSDGVFYVVSNAGAREKLVTGNKNWYKVKLAYTKADKFVSILNRRFGNVECIVLPDEMSFLVCVDDKGFEEIELLKSEVDLKVDTYLVELKYIRPEELLKYLPPGVDKGCLFFADDNSCVYFKGTENAYLNLLEQVKICDRPVVRVSYDLLILQYEEGTENSWSPNFSAGKMKIGDKNDFGIKLGNVLNLNLNVISAFGLDFAAQLQASIEENKTSVFADTTLHGVAGKQINFQNTNTYRYRDNNLDPDTGKPVYSGVTKEIVSGLKLDVIGFVSGDGMITSTVTASVTRQGIDTSSSTGNPPATSEKIVTTEICGKSGEPIVISGLVQNTSSQSSSGVPLISKVPFLGGLFKRKEKIVEKSQMVIYLVPHIEEYNSSFVADQNTRKNNQSELLERCNAFYKKMFMEETNAQL
jgi:hypothetical protein